MSILAANKSNVAKYGKPSRIGEDYGDSSAQGGADASHSFVYADNAANLPVDPFAASTEFHASRFAASAPMLQAVASAGNSAATPNPVTPAVPTAIPAGAANSSSAPSWVHTLATASIAADMTAADVNGTVTYFYCVTSAENAAASA
jgi:hypothetical protein